MPISSPAVDAAQKAAADLADAVASGDYTPFDPQELVDNPPDFLDPSQQTTVFTSDHAQSPYDNYACTIHYFYDAGLLPMVPAVAATVANPKPSTRMARVRAASGAKVVTYSTKRAGSQPAVPAPVEGTNEALLSAVVIPKQPYLEPGGSTFMYEVTAIYTYVLLKPRTYDQGYPVGVPPHLHLDNETTALPSENFVSGDNAIVPADDADDAGGLPSVLSGAVELK